MTLSDRYHTELNQRLSNALLDKQGEINQLRAVVTGHNALIIAAETRTVRARHLHCRDDSNPLGPWCGTCSVPWPCQTWEALTEPAHPKET